MLKRAIKVGFLGMMLALIAFSFNYHFAPTSLPGYEVLAAPAMFALRFFSEETPFWPKLIIFLAGQFLAFFMASLVFIKLKRLFRH